MQIGIPKETFPGERRVALVPEGIASLSKASLTVLVERDAGSSAGYSDQKYRERGATIGARSDVLQSDVVLQVRGYGENPQAGRDDLAAMRPGQTLIGLWDPLGKPQLAKEAAERGVSIFALELLPRITRAQSMDVLSSMATIAGYRAVLLAASASTRMFPMLMTAAGTVAPAKVLVIGAGVAGLQAIATARKLGGVVRAYDVRPAVKEQVQSLGAKFVELGLETDTAETKEGYAKALGEDFNRRQQEALANVVGESDVVISTAAIPGKRSPLLVTRSAVERMSSGSVIVDLAAERGGNCELTQADQTVDHRDVTILGPTNPASDVPYHASQMYSKNITTFLLSLIKNGQLTISTDDEIQRETLVARGGAVVHPRMVQPL